MLEADRDYVEGNNSDECEEEIDDSGSELEMWFAKLPNEYEADASGDEEMDGSKADSKDEDTEMSDFDGFSDSTFEGFSD
jgi:hypothetical protein